MMGDYFAGQMVEDGKSKFPHRIFIKRLILIALARSQSRMRGDFLFYEEKIETTQEEREAKAARRLQLFFKFLTLI